MLIKNLTQRHVKKQHDFLHVRSKRKPPALETGGSHYLATERSG
jgi:hypothetical protein